MRQPDDKDHFLESVIENEVRGDMEDDEKGAAFLRARDLYDLTQEELGRIIGKSARYVRSHEIIAKQADRMTIRLLRDAGRHDYNIESVVAGIDDVETQRAVAKRIANEGIQEKEAIQLARG